MRVDFKFRNSPHSEELTAHVHEHLASLEKYELKPVHVVFTFAPEKTSKRVDLHLTGQNIEMHASCEAQDYFAAVDAVVKKMARQLARKKAKVQAHKGIRRKALKVS